MPFYKNTSLELNFSQTKTCIQTTKQIGLIKSVWFLTPKSLNFMKTCFLMKTAAFYKKYPFLIKKHTWPTYKKTQSLREAII